MIDQKMSVSGIVLERPRFLHAHRVIWGLGGPWGRFFLLVGVFTYSFLPAIFVWMFWRFWERSFPAEAILAFALAAATYGAFHETLSTPMFGARVIRKYLDEGLFIPVADYLQEFARFVEAENRWGLFPGAVTWSIAFWTVYYSLLGASIAFAFALTPVFDLATPIVFALIVAPVVFACWLAWKFHVRRVSRDSIRKGYRLEKLSPPRPRAL